MAQMFEVTLQGTYQQQQIINRLSFVSDNDLAATANAVSLTMALGLVPLVPSNPTANSVLDRYLECQTNLFRLEEVLVRNLYVVTDFYTVALSGSGWLGTIAPSASGSVPFVANKLQTNRVRTDIRRGSLALTPFIESVYSADGTIDPASVALLQALADALNEPPQETVGSDTTIFQPAVFKKEEYPVPDSDPVRTAYRYYADPAVQLANTAVGVTWFPRNSVTSQVSRRIGKGA